jgi:hypothetical protein
MLYIERAVEHEMLLNDYSGPKTERQQAVKHVHLLLQI